MDCAKLGHEAVDTFLASSEWRVLPPYADYIMHLALWGCE